MENNNRAFMRRAILEAKKSTDEDERVHPKVGVVVVKDNKVLTVAHRGELTPGGHAEYTALEEKLTDETLAGSTVYTTLEPCTTRTHPKVPCAQRLVERKVARVVIGMLDPNPDIRGKGQLLLRDANIVTDLFPGDLMSEVEELNREFIRAYRESSRSSVEYARFVEANRERPLDEWYMSLNNIYWGQNYYRSDMTMFIHLVEVIGGLSMLASDKTKPDLAPESFVVKALAWWMTLCGKVGVRSVSHMVWRKFPYVCAYCHCYPHNQDECIEKRADRPGPDWKVLEDLSRANSKRRPTSLGSWQRMFSDIYPAQQTEGFGPTFARLMEELGELAEALRVFRSVPGYFLSEAADVFAWLMHIQNLIEMKRRTVRADRGLDLEISLCRAYPDRCLDCNEDVCRCQPILPSTVGRIAHEVPADWGSFGVDGSFMTSDKTQTFFRLGNPKSR